MGVDEIGVDEVGVDEMGSRRSWTTPFWQGAFLTKIFFARSINGVEDILFNGRTTSPDDRHYNQYIQD